LKHCRKKGHSSNHLDKNLIKQKDVNNQIKQPNLPIISNGADYSVAQCQIYIVKDASCLNNIILFPSQTILDTNNNNNNNNNNNRCKKFENDNQYNNENNQRSFGCQTNLLTQETGSQTFTQAGSSTQTIVGSINLNDINNTTTYNSSTSPLNLDLLNSSTSNLNNRETQTFRSFNNNETNTNYDYLDATTSTYLDNMFDPLNDKFTQTTTCFPYHQNNVTSTTSTNNMTQLDECIYSQEFLFENNLYQNNNNNKLSQSQHYRVSYSQNNNNNTNNRCTTPTNVGDESSLYGSFSISCQTENANLYQENINTMDTITQTDWVFDENMK
jgi:hypothetical protein